MQIDGEGKVIARARGHVPACLPQTSQSGEYAALACALQLLDGASTIFTDCANVARDWARKGVQATQFRKTYVGLPSQCNNSVGRLWVRDILWTKAHRSLKAVEALGDPEEMRKAKGNDAADAEAKAGIKLHPSRRKSRRKSSKSCTGMR